MCTGLLPQTDNPLLAASSQGLGVEAACVGRGCDRGTLKLVSPRSKSCPFL